MTTAPVKLGDIAARIYLHLRRMEADKERNLIRYGNPERSHLRFFVANCWRAGSRVRVSYVNYQGSQSLTRDEAIAYLAWLDAGNYGKHYDQQREVSG